jgi:hypothetical protein
MTLHELRTHSLDFIEGFASKFRPLLVPQELELLTAAPWRPHP